MIKTPEATHAFFSPGKVIISGEHSVVYGCPAIVMSIDLGITVTTPSSPKKIQQKRFSHIDHILQVFRKNTHTTLHDFSFDISSTLPQNSGLGSSAALSYALLQACARWENISLDNEEYFSLIQEAEIFAHGKPSGIDASAVVFQGCLRFQRTQGVFKRERILSPHLPQFLLIQSGKALETTKQMVESVAQIPMKENLMSKIGKITSQITEQIKSSTFDGALLTKNQRLLEKLNVVGEKAKYIISEIESAQGFAKIAGAGGVLDGSGMILAYHPNQNVLEQLAKKHAWQTYHIHMKDVHENS